VKNRDLLKKATLTIFVIGSNDNNLPDGNCFPRKKSNFDSLNTIASSTNSVSFISVNGALYQNAGATPAKLHIVCHVNEYFNRVESISIVFEIAVGTNYFFEIAKCAHVSFNLIAKEYNHIATV
jgi:methylmalonyl-CoA mutase